MVPWATVTGIVTIMVMVTIALLGIVQDETSNRPSLISPVSSTRDDVDSHLVSILNRTNPGQGDRRSKIVKLETFGPLIHKIPPVSLNTPSPVEPSKRPLVVRLLGDDDAASTTRDVGAAAFHFQRCSSCAIVSASGYLLNSGAGDAIDAHDCVIRMNTSPVKGYEKDVGARTDVRFMSHVSAKLFHDDSREFLPVLQVLSIKYILTSRAISQYLFGAVLCCSQNI